MTVATAARPATAATTFERRHIGPAPQEIDTMLAALGVDSLESLIAQTVPASILQKQPLDFGPALSETAALARLREIASANQVYTSYIGMGYHGTHTPLVILRNILENPAWYTAYTPYQPEISQGRLEALLNYQTMITDLTGLDIANASLLDEGTAAAEAMALAHRVASLKTKGANATTFFVDAEVHPQTIAVVRTRAEALGWTVVTGSTKDLGPRFRVCALFQYPASQGAIQGLLAPDRRSASAGCHRDLGGRSFGADLAEVPWRTGRRHRHWIHGSGLASRWAMVVHTPRIWRCATAISGRCRAGWWVYRSTRKAILLTGWRCKRENNIFAREKGDLQHLYGAGVVSGDRLDVRGVPRPRRVDAHCYHGGPPHRCTGGGTAPGRIRGQQQQLF